MVQALMKFEELSDDERIDLAVALWESVGDREAALPLTQSQAQELDRRVAAYKAGGESGTPWRECIDRISKHR